MKQFCIFGALLLVSVGQAAQACDAGPLTREAHFDQAEFVAIGEVKSERYLTDVEVEALPGRGAGYGSRPREVELVPVEPIVSEAPHTSRVLVPCGAKFPLVGERVVFGRVRSGHSWVYPADYGEPIIRALVRGKI